MADYDYFDFSEDVQSVMNNIPVWISLQYGIHYMKFQVNPKSIKMNIPSESTKAKVEELGEVSTLSKPGLANLSISSFFWQERNLVPTSQYVKWIKQWQRSKKPAKLIVTRLNYSMYVSCESFDYEVRAGEENDIYFDLQLQEYKQFGAKLVKFNDEIVEFTPDWFTSALNIRDNFASPILIEIPRPNRLRNLKIITNPYKTKENDTLVSITKKILGTTSGWKDLYELNKEKLGDMVANGKIPVNTEITLPDGWEGIKL